MPRVHPRHQHARWWACWQLWGRTAVTQSPITFTYSPSTPLPRLSLSHTHTHWRGTQVVDHQVTPTMTHPQKWPRPITRRACMQDSLRPCWLCVPVAVQPPSRICGQAQAPSCLPSAIASACAGASKTCAARCPSWRCVQSSRQRRGPQDMPASPGPSTRISPASSLFFFD